MFPHLLFGVWRCPSAFLLLVFLCFASGPPVAAQVVISEIHYHPVEEAAFSADGTPLVDLTDDVYEFVEVHNAGAQAVDLSGWKLAGGVDFTFPAGTSIEANGFRVIAKDRVRLAAAYGAPATPFLGDFAGKLGNTGDTVRLRNSAEQTVDSVNYLPEFPWPVTANALGVAERWTGIDPAAHQYKGRSLERVSVAASSNDPANWVASPLSSGPSPGAANPAARSIPKPVVVAYSVSQSTDGSASIRPSVPARLLCSFSSTAGLSGVTVEWFVDNIELFNEPRLTAAMTDLGGGRFTADLPGQANRSVVRFRIKADRGDGVEVVAPRADDPALTPVSATAREAWFAYFVVQPPTSNNPVYDCFVSSANLSQLNTNISQSPKRVTSGDANGLPREVPYVLPTAPLWNGTKPAIFVENGVVRDAQIRYHGSRYNRNAGRKSYKLLFPDHQKHLGADSVFITDKSDPFVQGQGIFIAAGLPVSRVRYVDWYFNNDGRLQRLEQGEYNGDLLDLYHEKIQRQNPGSVKEETGEFYKSTGTIESQGEGPYARGDEARLAAAGRWSALDRYAWTYALQNHAWRGAKPIKDFIEGMWNARGNSQNPNAQQIATLRTFMEANVDVDTTLTSLAIFNWMGPWDDTTQNHFLWRRANGRWVHLPWDFDGLMSGDKAGYSIFVGENGDPSNNFRGPNWFKDSFIKAFRAEFRQRMWELNNSFLDPANLTALGFSSAASFANSRKSNVNSQLAQAGFGTYHKPARPLNQQPAANAVVLPNASLAASAYSHSNTASPSPHTKSKWEIRPATGSYDDPSFVLVSTVDKTTLPIPFDQLVYGQSYFWRVTYYDADGHPSVVSPETRFTYGASSVAAGNVVINEVLADNRSSIGNGGRYPDYIELKNNTAASVDIGGWALTDDPETPAKFVFPEGTSIGANAYLLLWCDNDTSAPGLHTGFALNSGGQTLALTHAGAIRDTVTFGPQAIDLSIGRITDGTGGFVLNTPTPNGVNSPRTPLGSGASVRINEWMADTNNDDWFELHNADSNPVALGGFYLSDTPATPLTTKIPPLSFIGAKEFADFVADGSNAGANRVNFRLAGAGDTIVLTSTNGLTVIDSVTFGSQQTNVAQGRLPDGAANIVAFPETPTRARANYLPAPILINEVLNGSDTPFEDAIELYNPTAAPLDLSGWWLSDDDRFPYKFQIPAGTTISGGGYHVLYKQEFDVSGPGGFALGLNEDEVVLSAVDGAGAPTGFRARVQMSGGAQGVSFGRVATSTGADFFPQLTRTFGRDNPATVAEFREGTGGPNSGPRNGPVIINEAMYHPSDLAGGGDNSAHEFVEVHNVTTAAVDVSGWILKGAVTFTFPTGSVLRPGEYVVVGTLDPEDAAALNAFRSVYAIGTEIRIFGPYITKLPNGSATVELAKPEPAVFGEVPFLLIDRLSYSDTAPWPASADGGGLSLQRRDRAAFGNDVTNWSSGTATPGGVNRGQAAITDSDGDGVADVWETAHGFDPFNGADAARDEDSDGQSNAQEFAAGTDPRNAASVLRVAVTAASAGGMSIRFVAAADKSYTIQYRESLSSGVWTKLRDVPAEPAEREVEVIDAAAATQRFYRVVTPSMP